MVSPPEFGAQSGVQVSSRVDDRQPPSASSNGRSMRPQRLLLAFLGGLLYGPDERPVPTRIFIDTLRDLGVSEVATRATLARMTSHDLLTKEQRGRATYYSVTGRSRKLLADSAPRVRSENPFANDDGDWTLLTFSLPEARRDVRHQLRNRLSWAGFGSIRDGLWIASGRIDTREVLSGLPLDREELHSLAAFSAEPLPGTDIDWLVARAWDLGALRAEHERFLSHWEGAPGTSTRALPTYTALIADFLSLLRVDPRLPAAHLPSDWPAARSVATYRARSHELAAQAHRELGDALRSLSS
jgi:DNA-binding transcriptional regulator PaaX